TVRRQMADEQPPRSHVLAALYRIYERRLMRQVRAHAVPRHVGVILDGNRRHGRQCRLTEPEEAYAAGAKKLDDLLNRALDLGIPPVTFCAPSTDNLARNHQQVFAIRAAMKTKFPDRAKAPKSRRQRVRVRAIGQLDLLPAPTLAAVRAAEIATQDYDGLCLTIAAAYGGREEITD